MLLKVWNFIQFGTAQQKHNQDYEIQKSVYIISACENHAYFISMSFPTFWVNECNHM